MSKDIESIQISSGKQRIMINDDPNRVIEFDPHDLHFAERFYQIFSEFQAKQAEFQRRSKRLHENREADEYGVPVKFQEGLDLAREVCQFLRDKIDQAFGPGTSQTAFGDDMNIHQIAQFMQGMTRFINPGRGQRVKRDSTGGK